MFGTSSPFERQWFPPSDGLRRPDSSQSRAGSRAAVCVERRPSNSQLWISTSGNVRARSGRLHQRIDSFSIERRKSERDSGPLSVIEVWRVPRTGSAARASLLGASPLGRAERACERPTTRNRGSVAGLEKSHIDRPSRSRTARPRARGRRLHGCSVRAQRTHAQSNVGQRKDVQAAGRGLAVGVERRPAGDHRLREPVHVRPVLLQQLLVVTKLCRIGRISAVHEEVQLQQSLRAATTTRGAGKGSLEELDFTRGVCEVTEPHGYAVLIMPGAVRSAQVGRKVGRTFRPVALGSYTRIRHLGVLEVL